MDAMASQITSVSIICSTVCSGADQRRHQSSASLAFVRGIHLSQVDSPHKGPVTRKCFHLVTSSCIDGSQRGPTDLSNTEDEEMTKSRRNSFRIPYRSTQRIHRSEDHKQCASILRIYYHIHLVKPSRIAYGMRIRFIAVPACNLLQNLKVLSHQHVSIRFLELSIASYHLDGKDGTIQYNHWDLKKSRGAMGVKITSVALLSLFRSPKTARGHCVF